MARNERHVVRDPDGGWNVVKPHHQRISDHTDTQDQATDRAREIVGGIGGGEVVIHRPDGRIRDSDTVPPGHDPFPPRDEK
jgi:hypothetical protein